MTDKPNPIDRLSNFFNPNKKDKISSREPVVPAFLQRMLILSAADAVLDLANNKPTDAKWEIAEAVFWVAAAAVIAYRKNHANHELYQDLQYRLNEIQQEDEKASVPVNSDKSTVTPDHLINSIASDSNTLILSAIAAVSIIDFGQKFLRHQGGWAPSAVIALSCVAVATYGLVSQALLDKKINQINSLNDLLQIDEGNPGQGRQER
jgi:hypothetical protein